MIPKPALLLIFLVLLSGTIAMMVVLQRHGAPLGEEGHYKIVALEMEPIPSRAFNIVQSWQDKKLLDVALEDIRFDYAFIVLYTATLALTGFYGAIVWTGWPARAGAFLGWAMLVAGLMDVFENLGMAAEIGGNYSFAPFVCAVSSIKWVISGAAFLYSLPTLVMMLRKLRSLLR